MAMSKLKKLTEGMPERDFSREMPFYCY